MIRFADGSVRYFTILEAKRIQTFPDDYPILGSWTEAMRQLGNAVPVQLGQTVAKTLLSKLAWPYFWAVSADQISWYTRSRATSR
jgi:DNA (cytosine-5)-methyltransferase 1